MSITKNIGHKKHIALFYKYQPRCLLRWTSLSRFSLLFYFISSQSEERLVQWRRGRAGMWTRLKESMNLIILVAGRSQSGRNPLQYKFFGVAYKSLEQFFMLGSHSCRFQNDTLCSRVAWKYKRLQHKPEWEHFRQWQVVSWE